MEQDRSKLHFGHGLTVGQIEKIRDQQAGKDLTPFKYFPANRLGTVKDKYIQEQFGNYEVVEHEAGFYHIFQENRLFDQSSGAKLSVGCIQIYSESTYQRLEKSKAFKAFSHVVIIHDPTIKEEKKSSDAGQGNPPPPPPVMTIEEAKAKYKELTGKAAFHAWSVETILAKMEAFQKGNQ